MLYTAVASVKRGNQAVRILAKVSLLGMLCACATHSQTQAPTPIEDAASQSETVVVREPKIALALGGGAAKGFAHIGVIKALEAHGIEPDIVVGTSAGSVVASLFAAGYNGFDLQRISLSMDEDTVSDWVLPNRGFIRGDALQNFINEAVQNRPIQALNRKLAVVATDLQSGEAMIFQSGNTGMAVRASSSVPGIFRPVKIGTREFVDGGLVSPVPVSIARSLGADIVIAVNISEVPQQGQVSGTFEILLQTFTIMGHVIAAQELQQADIVISPNISELKSASFESKNYAVIEGEKAGLSAIPAIQKKIEAFRVTQTTPAVTAAPQ